MKIKKILDLQNHLNKLLKISNGKYIARQDADDVSLPHRLTTQINFIKKRILRLLLREPLSKTREKNSKIFLPTTKQLGNEI